VSRIYDLKGSQRDRYAADDPAVPGACIAALQHTRGLHDLFALLAPMPGRLQAYICIPTTVSILLLIMLRLLRLLPPAAGAVLLDENLKELNLSSPTLVGPRAFARLQRALWSGARAAGKRGRCRVSGMLILCLLWRRGLGLEQA
jgi:hypothetical protein